MPDMDCGTFDVGCRVVGQPAADSMERLARDIVEWASDMLGRAMAWWIYTPSVNPDSEAVRTIQTYTTPLIGLVLMLGLLSQCIRMVLTRKLEPLVDIALGLVRYAIVVSMGLTLLGGAVVASDALAEWMLEASLPQFSEGMRQALLAGDPGTNMVGMALLGLILGLLSVIQWIIGFLRQAAILVLAGLLPLAASGSLSKMGKEWLPKMLPWLLALVAYKPMAAFIYATGLTFVGQGDSLGEVMTGLTILTLAVIALWAMMKFFSWAGVSPGGGGGLGSALGSFAGARMGGGGGAPTGAAEQSTGTQRAREMDSTGPNGGAQPAGAAPQTRQGGAPDSGPPQPDGAGAGTGVSSSGAGQGSAAMSQSSTAAGGGGAGATGGAGAVTGVGAAAAGAQAINEGIQQSAGEMTGGADDQQQ